MKVHRFYTGDKLALKNKVWVNDAELMHQWTRVLRFSPDQQIILFNDDIEERLYKIDKIEKEAVHLSLVTELSPNVPKKDIYLCFSLLKKDKNDWVLQKATELGVRHFIPLITERTEKTGFNLERALKIVKEASEQCGRTDIPRVRESIRVETAIDELTGKVDLFIAEQGNHIQDPSFIIQDPKTAVAVLIGPEGGWTDKEKAIFKEKEIKHLALSSFTLRAETAAITAVALLQ